MRSTRFWQAIVALNGAAFAATGAFMLAAPSVFWEYVGDFPPYNRHYVVDLGAYVLPLGLGLLLAARRPPAHLGLIGVGAAAALLHAASHGYDLALSQETVLEFALVALPAALLAAAFLALRRTRT